MDRDFLFSANRPESALQINVYDLDQSSLYAQNPDQVSWQIDSDFQKELASNSGTFIFKADPDDLVVLHAISPVTGWRYVGTSSMPIFFKQYRHISRLLMALAAAALPISFLLSFFAAKKLYKPLRGLVSLVQGGDSSRECSDEYQYIHNAYSSMKEANQNMHTTIDQLRPAVKDNFFFSLILGEPMTPEEIETKLDFIREDFSPFGYGVIILLISNYENYIQQFDEQTQLLHSCQISGLVNEAAGSCPYALLHLNRFSWSLVINSKDSENRVLLTILSTLKRAAENLPFPLLINGGNTYESISDLPYSYREAQESLKFQQYNPSGTAAGATASPSHTVYYLNTKLEEALLQAVRTGSPAAVEEPCMNIYQNMRQYSASYNDVSITASHIMNQILEILISLEIDLDSHPELTIFYKALNSCATIGDIQMLLKNTAGTAASCVESFNRQRSDKTIERLKEYVRTHLGEDISLQDLADYSQMSPSYVSRLFKKHLNIGFVEYLNTLRINRAKRLLEDTQMTVEQVGFQVGFNNVRSFMRLFKQYEGTSPGQYRSQALTALKEPS
ncbi:AraC family transcriptional regulator [Clostridium sp. AM58-1XD]|uniref:helix-turn-helix domain-containing protein n=1 Tax=Clostridium sp. AM58-1XD TaxID=2292307 RepID=UPI0015F689E9|nr:AraC family transcriptional regulator [Clostridium sp. AM58-1XD]